MAGVAKAATFGQFTAALEGYRWAVAPAMLRAGAAVIVCGEILVGFGVLIGRSRHAAAASGLALLLTFTIAVASALLKPNRPTKCGCIPFRDERMGWHICVRNAGLGLLLVPAVLPVSWLLSFAAGTLLLVSAAVVGSGRPVPTPR